jgi:hypothetical protein
MGLIEPVGIGAMIRPIVIKKALKAITE